MIPIFFEIRKEKHSPISFLLKESHSSTPTWHARELNYEDVCTLRNHKMCATGRKPKESRRI